MLEGKSMPSIMVANTTDTTLFKGSIGHVTKLSIIEKQSLSVMYMYLNLNLVGLRVAC